MEAISQSISLPAGYVFRAKLILMLAEGASFRTIKYKFGTTAPTVIRWKERFLSGGIDGPDTYRPLALKRAKRCQSTPSAVLFR